MIVDTSAIVAVIAGEAGWQHLADQLGESGNTAISAANYLELGIVIDRQHDATASRRLDAMLDAWRISIDPVSADQARVARAAHRDFGRGSGHPARLNYGDCFAYALAVTKREPLLFVGDDFIHTDVIPA